MGIIGGADGPTAIYLGSGILKDIQLSLLPVELYEYSITVPEKDNKITNDNLSVEALEYILEKQDELEINSKEVLEIIKEHRFLFVEKGQLYCGRYGDIEVLLEEDDFQDKHEYELLKEVFGNE